MSNILGEVLSPGREVVICAGVLTTASDGTVSSVSKGMGLLSASYASGVYTVVLDTHLSSIAYADAKILNTTLQDDRLQCDTVTTGAAGTATVTFNLQAVSSGAADTTNGVPSSQIMILVIGSRSGVPGGGVT